MNLNIDNFADVDLTKYFEDIDFDNMRKTIDNKVNNHNDNRISTIKSKPGTCPSCGGCNFVDDFSYGIVVCTNSSCGQVLENILDYGPEWKNYEDDDKNNGRCGMPINKLLPQSSLGTNIGGARQNRLKILHGWNAMPYKERSLNHVFKAIQEKCYRNNILKCIEDDAKIMYKAISECKHTKGKNKGKFIITRGINRVSIIAACVFFACRRKGMTRTPKELADIFDIEHMEMNRGCKNFLKLLKIKKFNMNMGTSSAEHFIKRYCNKKELRIKTEYMEEALKIAKNIEKLNVASVHTPYSVAAASILLMADINGLMSITKKKLATEFEVSEVTISKTYKKIEPYRDIINDVNATNKIANKIDKQSKDVVMTQEILDKMKLFGINIDVKQSTMNLANNVQNICNNVITSNKSDLENNKVDLNNKTNTNIDLDDLGNIEEFINDDDDLELDFDDDEILDDDYDEIIIDNTDSMNDMISRVKNISVNDDLIDLFKMKNYISQIEQKNNRKKFELLELLL